MGEVLIGTRVLTHPYFPTKKIFSRNLKKKLEKYFFWIIKVFQSKSQYIIWDT